MESSISVSAPFKGVFWHFKVDRRIYLTDTVEVILKLYYHGKQQRYLQVLVLLLISGVIEVPIVVQFPVNFSFPKKTLGNLIIFASIG